MPIYEYQCKKCGAREELLQSHGEIVDPRCPKCRRKMVRLVSAPAIQFKGSGWYVTDYGRRGGASEGKGGESEKPGGSAEKTAEGGKTAEKNAKKTKDQKPVSGASTTGTEKK
jgi:putative FmdB family regulatory protein